MSDQAAISPLRWRTALAFIAVGLVLYAGAFAGSEMLVYRNGHANPFFKIATATRPDFDWVVLGASHAMPLDFSDTQAAIEQATGLNLINLAAQGAGPLYNRFVLEQFLVRHRTRSVLYVVDSFAFGSRLWNEDRIADPKLLSRTPLDPGLAGRLAAAVVTEGVDWRAPLDYVTGFSKLNNASRFTIDVWEGEAQFDRRYRPSATASKERIAYLYPTGAGDAASLARYFDAFEGLLDAAAAQGATVTVVKLPLPKQFLALLPNEASFDAALTRRLADRGVPYVDFSHRLDGADYFFDSDHLGRAGVAAILDQGLRALLISGPQS